MTTIGHVQAFLYSKGKLLLFLFSRLQTDCHIPRFYSLIWLRIDFVFRRWIYVTSINMEIPFAFLLMSEKKVRRTFIYAHMFRHAYRLLWVFILSLLFFSVIKYTHALPSSIQDDEDFFPTHWGLLLEVLKKALDLKQ